MSVNLLSRVRGSAVLLYNGQAFWTKDVSALELQLQAFDIKSDAFGSRDKRAGGRIVEITFTPEGVWTPAQLAVLYPYAASRFGDFNTPVRTVSAVNTGSNQLTVTAHGFIQGTGIRIGAIGAGAQIPAGLAANTTYYVIAVDANTISLADTQAHALAGTNIIDITSAGGGKIKVIQNSPLTVWTEDGLQLVLWNAAISQMPSLSLSTTDSIIGQVKFEAYTLHGQNWSDANSLYTFTEDVPLTLVPPDPSNIPTVPFTIDWASALAVTAFSVGGHTMTINNHGFVTGQSCTVEASSAGGALPAGIMAGVTYYIIAVDANTISLADTQGHALAGTNLIDFTDSGTGTIEILGSTQILGLQPRDAIKIDFPVKWNDVKSDANGIDCRSIESVDSTVKFVPNNMDIATLFSEIDIQGAGAGRGQSLPSANLDIYGPNFTPFIRVFGAALTNAPSKFGTQEDRIGELSLMTKRTFRGGAANPIFFVGSAAPTT